jgi:hypothetical protein
MSRREQAVLDMFFLFSFFFFFLLWENTTHVLYRLEPLSSFPCVWGFGEGEPFNPMINGKSIYFTTFFFSS